jgi:thiol-disulfide isomerase/thioredoxin
VRARHELRAPLSVRIARHRPIWVLVSALVLGALLGCSVEAAVPGGRQPDRIGPHVIPRAQRRSAPDLTGTTLSGKRFTLANHLGGPIILVNVWASWCAPCRQEMPTLAKAAATEGGSDLLVVGVDERDRSSSARAFSSSLGASYPSLVDSDSRLLAQLPMLPHNAIPSSLVIDRDGAVAAWVVGPLTSQALTSVLSRVKATS